MQGKDKKSIVEVTRMGYILPIQYGTAEQYANRMAIEPYQFAKIPAVTAVPARNGRSEEQGAGSYDDRRRTRNTARAAVKHSAKGTVIDTYS